jgi:hypothetical protein
VESATNVSVESAISIFSVKRKNSYTSALIERASSSGTWLNRYRTKRRNNPEDIDLQRHRYQNVTSHLRNFLCCSVNSMIGTRNCFGNVFSRKPGYILNKAENAGIKKNDNSCCKLHVEDYSCSYYVHENRERSDHTWLSSSRFTRCVSKTKYVPQ